MKIPESEWSFKQIRAESAARADLLEAAGSREELLRALAVELLRAMDQGDVRLAMDSLGNRFMECRSIVQFKTSPEIYEWFYSARTGYRAQFWLSPENGIPFHSIVLETLIAVIAAKLPEALSVRAITLDQDSDTHEESDAGAKGISRVRFLKSFRPDVSNIWICERRYSTDGTQPRNIGDIELSAAARSAKLHVPRWDQPNPDTGGEGEGLFAPLPLAENAWLELKGGFLDSDGNISQVKPSDLRARQIHNYGWTWRIKKK
jgi:hypothetical protein